MSKTFHFFEELLRDVREVGALGNVLTDESVGVLVGSTLPGMVRSGEVEFGKKIL